MGSSLRCTSTKYLRAYEPEWRSKMGISTLAKNRSRPTLRSVQQRARHHQGYATTPSEKAIESNGRDGYYWRR